MTNTEEATQSGEGETPKIFSEQIEGITLYLIPRAIADLIHEKREAVANIDVRQGAGHFYTITVTTSERRMLRSKRAQSQADDTVSNASDAPSSFEKMEVRAKGVTRGWKDS